MKRGPNQTVVDSAAAVDVRLAVVAAGQVVVAADADPAVAVREDGASLAGRLQEVEKRAGRSQRPAFSFLGITPLQNRRFLQRFSWSAIDRAVGRQILAAAVSETAGRHRLRVAAVSRMSWRRVF